MNSLYIMDGEIHFEQHIHLPCTKRKNKSRIGFIMANKNYHNNGYKRGLSCSLAVSSSYCSRPL